MAKRFFPDRNAVGSHFAFGGGNKVVPDILIVGVVKDVKQEHVNSAPQPYVYIPYAQRPKLREMTFYVRSERNPLLLASSLQDVVRQMDANLPVFDLKTMQRVVEEDLFSARMVAVLVGMLRRSGGAAGGTGHLRRASLRCCAAHARDWHPYGARRAGRQCAAS